MASRLPMLQSDWLVSEVSEEPDMLRSSPPTDGKFVDETAKEIIMIHLAFPWTN